jgi:hypothetical protein
MSDPTINEVYASLNNRQKNALDTWVNDSFKAKKQLPTPRILTSLSKNPPTDTQRQMIDYIFQTATKELL